MRELYVSDLDGTLLRRNERTSAYTNRVINELTSRGMLFSYATARSHVTSTKVTQGLHAKIPIITYNGAVILQNDTFETIQKNIFQEEKMEILDVLRCHGISPIVYAYISGKEKFSYFAEKCSPATLAFLGSRRGDPRENPLKAERGLAEGEVFYFTCIDQYEKLEPVYLQCKEKYHCVFQRDIYSGEQWLEIMPKNVSKANAVLQLKEYLGVDYVVAFGDGKNDIELFRAADESYAVENAAEELKSLATDVIGSNECDSVAKWLHHRFYGR